MARVHYSGLEIIDKKFYNMERDAVKRVVMAGAKALTKATKRNIETYHHVVTGSMRDSVQPGEYEELYAGGKVEVFPQGDDSKGLSNAKKAFVIDHGLGHFPRTIRSNDKIHNKTGDRFLSRRTSKLAETATVMAMEEEYDRIVKEANE